VATATVLSALAAAVSVPDAFATATVTATEVTVTGVHELVRVSDVVIVAVVLRIEPIGVLIPTMRRVRGDRRATGVIDRASHRGDHLPERGGLSLAD